RTWEEYDRKLDTQIQLNTRRLQSSMLGNAETSWKCLSRLLWIELLVCLIAAGWLIWFVWHKAAESLYLIPAAALGLSAISLVIAGIRQIAALSAIDYSAPVVVLQK